MSIGMGAFWGLFCDVYPSLLLLPVAEGGRPSGGPARAESGASG